MDAIQLMMDEHRLIEKVIDALEEYGGRIRKGEEGDRVDLSRFLRFIREYADACHHGKEEDILFDMMTRCGFPKATGPLGVMYHEHMVGRNFAGIMQEGVEAVGPWPEVLRDQVLQAIDGYAEVLRAHIQKEDNVLYPMAAEKLPEEAMQEVQARCREKEEAQRADGSKATLEILAGELIEKYGP